MTSKKPGNWNVAVIDAETDPFKAERVPAPFVFGFFDGHRFLFFWGADCVDQLLSFLRSLPVRTVVYAHNGGKFDFMFLLPFLEGKIIVINGRIAKAKIGHVELRDSWSILPFALEQFDKGEIDYEGFERETRDRNRASILDYLARDCRSLWTLVSSFRGRFGDGLTVGGCAIKTLGTYHEIEATNALHDGQFRPYYFGGRVSIFEYGHIKGDLKLYDRNSMYPAVMAESWHPNGRHWTEFTDSEAHRFVIGKGYPWCGTLRTRAMGAFPVRDERTGKLEFPATGERRTFRVFGPEYEEACRLGLVDPSARFEKVWQCEGRQRFDGFVNALWKERYEHQAKGKRALELSVKWALNSSYGKWAQNPDNFEEFYIRRPGDGLPGSSDAIGAEWTVHTDYGADRGEIWHRSLPSHQRRFFDVAVAASITSCSRAVLMRALHGATRPLYCDTDSILCEAPGAGMDLGKGLGQWKLEAEASEAFILARKLYSLWDGDRCVKSSAKGIQKAELTKSDWKRLIDGAELEIANPAPCFKISGEVTFTKRRIRYVRA